SSALIVCFGAAGHGRRRRSKISEGTRRHRGDNKQESCEDDDLGGPTLHTVIVRSELNRRKSAASWGVPSLSMSLDGRKVATQNHGGRRCAGELFSLLDSVSSYL